MGQKLSLPYSESFEIMKNADLIDVKDSKNIIKSDQLWKDRGAIIFIIRRPGCQVCRVIFFLL